MILWLLSFYGRGGEIGEIHLDGWLTLDNKGLFLFMKVILIIGCIWRINDVAAKEGGWTQSDPLVSLLAQ